MPLSQYTDPNAGSLPPPPRQSTSSEHESAPIQSSRPYPLKLDTAVHATRLSIGQPDIPRPNSVISSASPSSADHHTASSSTLIDRVPSARRSSDSARTLP